ncbi:MAG: hypothetical protein WA144_00755 [Candidatus Methanoperedens sp.]
MDSKDALVVFEGTKIRRTWYDEQWYFSVVDIVRILTESADPKDYWYRLKKREVESSMYRVIDILSTTEIAIF